MSIGFQSFGRKCQDGRGRMREPTPSCYLNDVINPPFWRPSPYFLLIAAVSSGSPSLCTWFYHATWPTYPHLVVVFETQDFLTFLQESAEILSPDQKRVGGPKYRFETFSRRDSIQKSRLGLRISNSSRQCFRWQRLRFQGCLGFVLISSCLGVSSWGRPLSSLKLCKRVLSHPLRASTCECLHSGSDPAGLCQGLIFPLHQVSPLGQI